MSALNRFPRPNGTLRTPASWMLAGPLVALALCAPTGCGEAPEDAGELSSAALADRQQELHRQFDGSIAPARVVARVGEQVVTAGELGIYLALFPGLSVRDAVHDLVEMRALEQSPVSGGQTWEEGWLDGRTLGLARAHLRAVIARELDRDRIAAEALAAVDSAEMISLTGIPAMRTVFHALVRVAEDAPSDRVEAAESLADELHGVLAAHDGPIDRDVLRVLTAPYQLDPRLDGGRILVEGPMRIARNRRELSRAVGGVAAVGAFSERAFETPVGEVAAPVRTQFGIHVIAVVNHADAVLPEPDERREIVEGILVARAAESIARRRLAAARRQVRTHLDPEAAELLGQDALDRLQSARQQSIEALR